MKDLEKRVVAIEKRKKVETDKAWETSWIRNKAEIKIRRMPNKETGIRIESGAGR